MATHKNGMRPVHPGGILKLGSGRSSWIQRVDLESAPGRAPDRWRYDKAADLAINGKRLRADQADAIRTILDLAAGALEGPGLASWIRANIA